MSSMMLLTCSIALRGVADGGLDRADLAGDLLGRLARSARRATSPPRRRPRSPCRPRPARAASMVALSASRLVCPAIAWIRPITSPMRVAASPAPTWCAPCAAPRSPRGRPPRSTRIACSAIAADRAGELLDRASGRAVTLPEAEPTRSSAVRASADTELAALSSCVEAISSRSAASRSLASAWSTDASNRAMVAAISSLRCSRARLVSACAAASCARSMILSRNTITVRAMRAELVLDSGGRDLRRGIAVGEPLHRVGQAVERPGDAAADHPASRKPEQRRPRGRRR